MDAQVEMAGDQTQSLAAAAERLLAARTSSDQRRRLKSDRDLTIRSSQS